MERDRLATDLRRKYDMGESIRDLASAKEELDALLKSSVREHLLSDVPLGVWSSGGLDSSAVVH